MICLLATKKPTAARISIATDVRRNDGFLFCRASNRVSDLRHDEETRTSVYRRFCPRGAANLRRPDLVLQDEAEPGSRGDCEWAAQCAHANFDCVRRHFFLCRTGTLRCHADAEAVARRCFAQSGGTIDHCWLVIHISYRGRQRVWHSCCIGRSNPCRPGISAAAVCPSVYHHERGSDFVRSRWDADLVRLWFAGIGGITIARDRSQSRADACCRGTGYPRDRASLRPRLV